MGWEETGVTDLLNIPDRMQMHWKFFNAFFKAFQERAYYTEVGPRPIFYDDLILDGPQIHQTELRARLNSFNEAIQLNWTVSTLSFPPFTKTLAEQWLKVDTWDEFGTFTSALEDDLEDEIFWGYTELRTLLTDDVFDSILVDYTYENNFNPAYWTGIYQLINLMEYRGLTISTFVAPVGVEPDEVDPRLWCNDLELLFNISSGTLTLDELMTQAIADSTIIIGAGTLQITSGRATQSTSSRTFGGGRQEGYGVSTEYRGMWSDPYVITPLEMEIRTRLEVLETDWKTDDQRKNRFNVWDQQDTRDLTPIPSGREVITSLGVVGTPTYTPDLDTWFAKRYINLNVPSIFDPMTSRNNWNKDTVPDIRITQTVDITPVTPVPIPVVDGITFVSKTREENNDYQLDRAICRIPLEFLEYQEQTPP